MSLIIIIIIIISSFEKVKGAVGDCKVILRTKFRWWRPKIICFKGPGARFSKGPVTFRA